MSAQEIKPFNYGQLNVMAEACDECLFSKSAIVDNERRRDILQQCSERDTFFACHKGTLNGDLPVCCRAFFESHNTLPVRLAKLTNAIRFIDEEDLPKLNPVGSETPIPDIEFQEEIVSAQLPSTNTLDRDGLADYLAEQDSLLEVNGREVFEPSMWIRADQKMAGDDILKERDNHSDYCSGCDFCWSESFERGADA